MLKRVFTAILFCIFISLTSQACDICGCGFGNYYIGMLPQFNRSFIGIRYHYQHFHTQLANDKTQFSNDYFQSLELWGGFNIGKKWQALVFIPYSFNQQNSDDGLSRTKGLGDVAVLVNYSLLEKTSLTSNNKLLFQQLTIGGGVKLPTGKSDIDANAPDIVALANSQLGSGSTDLMVNAGYTIKINRAGFVTNLNYKYNTGNKENYKFGNRFSSNSFVIYSLMAGNVSIIPNLGFLYENSNSNSLNNNKVAETGGTISLGSIGVEFQIKRIGFGLNAQLPLAQNFASGQTENKIRGMAHVSWAF